MNSPERREMQGEFVVSLVQHQDHVAGKLRQKALHPGCFQHGAGRIVGIGQKHNARVRVDRSENRVEIETIFARAHGSFDETRTRRLHCHGIHNK
jgi:hypothetical protein